MVVLGAERVVCGAENERVERTELEKTGPGRLYG